ncbi:MAG TPA: LPS assembly lipoprotein LptE [Candidatus Kapabacteria bacterium]|nr:LPS assembly lipoprotein LptE [Candidatus Kapabacteria bacterium]
MNKGRGYRVEGRGYGEWAIPSTLYPLPYLLALLLISACYSFTGASIPPWIHTIGIPLVEDNSGFGNSAVRQDLTNQLVQDFTSDGSLQVANRSVSDAVVEVSIPVTGIMDEPVNVQAGTIVTTKRITLHAHAIYRDQKKQKVFWERDFTETSDYTIANGLPAQQVAIQTAEKTVAQDILIAVISNW